MIAMKHHEHSRLNSLGVDLAFACGCRMSVCMPCISSLPPCCKAVSSSYSYVPAPALPPYNVFCTAFISACSALHCATALPM